MSIINVIGGSGFIGTRLCSRLVSSKCLFSIIDKSLSILHGNQVDIADVRDINKLRDSITDNAVIVNLAAEHRDDVKPLSLYDEVNVGGAENVCIVARERNIKTIIFTSTVAVYVA